MTLKVRISYRVKVKPISNTVTNTTDQNNNKENSIVNNDKIHLDAITLICVLQRQYCYLIMILKYK